MSFNPSDSYICGFSPIDGTVEFYSRVHAILENRDFVVADIGAGRGQWYFEDPIPFRRKLQYLRPITRKLYGIDIDPVVLKNETTSENILMSEKGIPLENSSVDAILADWVFEHIENPSEFANELNRILRPGGFLFARTPHRYNYVSFFARIFRNNLHVKVLKHAQPSRLSQDVFPTKFKMNTKKKIKQLFPNYRNYSYIFASEPAYYFGNKQIYNILFSLHKHSPDFFCGSIFVFLQKKV